MTKSANSFLKPSMNWLLVFIPVTLFAAPQPFMLAFTRGELTLVFMSILIAIFVATGGKTHWFKGVQLLTVYLIFAILFFLIPGK